MLNEVYNKVEKYVIETFSKNNDENGIKHLLRTAYWIKILEPRADESLLISAVAHDIERGFRDKSYNKITNNSKGFMSDEHLTYHQNEGARIMGEYLKEINADKKLINRVKSLVSKHEIGGNKNQNLLKDADSISFFENNVDHFIKKQIGNTSKEKVIDKFNWMFNRISSNRAKNIAKPFYEEAIRKVNNLKE
jgi:hypothetical protein